jgi:hypothetical protein
MDIERVALGEVEIEEAAPLCGRAGDELGVRGRMEHKREGSQEGIEGGVGRRVELEPLILAVEREFHRLGNMILNKGRFDVEKSFSHADELSEVLAAERAAHREEGDRFEKVGLALGVIAPNDIEPGREFDFRLVKITKIPEINTFKIHLSLTYHANSF